MSGLPSDPMFAPIAELEHLIRHPAYAVLYSAEKGVYLGQGKWSMSDPDYKKVALVWFNNREPVTRTRMLNVCPDAPADVRAVEVFPQHPARGATPDECGNVGLPLW